MVQHEHTRPDRRRPSTSEAGARAPLPSLVALLRNTSAVTVRNVLLRCSLHDVVSAMPSLSVADQVAILRVLPTRVASAVLDFLPPAEQRHLIAAMAPDDLAALDSALAPDDHTLFLSTLRSRAADQLLTLLEPRERAATEALLAYAPNSVGRLMTPQYVAVRATWTVQDVLDHVRTHGRDSETLDVLYVIDERGVLVNDVRTRELLLVPPVTPLERLLARRSVSLRAGDDQRSAVEVFKRENRVALPVVSDEGILIGIVTIDDVLDAAENLATRDLQRFGGSEALDEPYMAIPLTRMIRRRAGWLVVLFLGELLTATAMGYFEEEIARAVVLALFVPLIISSGGNSGSQASTLAIRALALGQVRPGEWARVARRELVVGLALGVLLGAIGFARIAGWSLVTNLYGPHWLLVAVAVALALVGVVLWGALIGSMLPFGLRRLGFDPAVSSAPFVATLVDVTGLIIYFNVSVLILKGTLL